MNGARKGAIAAAVVIVATCCVLTVAWAVQRAGDDVATAGPGTLQERVLARAVVVPVDGVAEVYPRVEGRVEQVAVREGDRVEAGALLAVVEAGALQAELARREAEARAAEEGLRLVAEGLRPEERTALDAEARAASREADLAGDRAARQSRLDAAGTSTEAAQRQAQIEWDIAKARQDSAEARLRAARSGSRPAEVQAARARLAAAEAAVAQARDEAARARIVAPRAGVVLARRIDPGDTISLQGQAAPEAVFEIADPGRVELRFEVEEVDAARVVPGLAVTVTTPGNQRVLGKTVVDRVAARLQKRAIGAQDARERAESQVRGAFAPLDGIGDLPPIGTRLEAVVDLPPRTVDVRVPREALRVRDGRATVRVPAWPWDRERTVELLAGDERYAEVRGLEAGEKMRLDAP